MAGDYAHYKNLYSDKTTNINILVASTAFADAIAPKSANHQLFIQKISLSITTHFDTAITFTDDAGVAIAKFTDEATAGTAGQGQEPTVFDFGPQGYPMVKGGNLDIAIGSAGVIGTVHIEAYEKLGAAISYLAGAALQ